MMIADSHTHIYPDKLAGRALRQIASFYGFTERMHEDERVGTVDYLLETDRRCGISLSLVSEAAHTPRLVGMLNDFIVESCRRAGGRFLGLAAIHPACERVGDILTDARARGLRGIKIHPDYQEFDMDDPMCDEMYDFCQQEGFPVLIHCGDERYDHSSPARLQRVIDRFPRLVVIAAHLGGFRRWQDAIGLRAREGVWFDTSSSLFALKREEALNFFGRFGVERFLFGSDYPLFDPPAELERFLRLGLSDGQNEQVLCLNFARLFGLPLRGEAGNPDKN